jgi:hypothetical protein
MKLALLFALAVVGCGSSSSPADAGSDATADVASDGIDCSSVGCGMNPGCGNVCTEVCGCCGCAYGAVCSSECDASSD